jgi:hypothetical protein
VKTLDNILLTGVYGGMGGFFVCMTLTLGGVFPQDGGLKAGMCSMAAFAVFAVAYVIKYIWEQ